LIRTRVREILERLVERAPEVQHVAVGLHGGPFTDLCRSTLPLGCNRWSGAGRGICGGGFVGSEYRLENVGPDLVPRPVVALAIALCSTPPA
jgi:hypothetical protein